MDACRRGTAVWDSMLIVCVPRRAVLAGIVVLGLLAAVSQAMGAEPGRPGADRPAKQRTIFDRQQELGLTEDQVVRMRAVVARLQQEVEYAVGRLNVAEKEYLALAAVEAPLSRIETKLQEIAAIQVQLRLKDVTASRAIVELLNPEQRRRWRQIQAAVRGGRADRAPLQKARAAPSALRSAAPSSPAAHEEP